MDVAAIATITLFAGAFIGWGVASAITRTHVAEQTAATRAERDGAVAERDRLLGERDMTTAERDQLRAERDDAAERARAAEIKVAGIDARLQAVAEAEQQLKDTFARMSSDALQANRQQFLDLADDRFRQAGRPLTETLGKFDMLLRDIEQKREGAHAALSEQISFVRMTGEQLRAETASLVTALRKPQARGQWGEQQLKNCVKYAGMIEHCDFIEQVTLTTPDGPVRPDMVVNLGDGKSVIVDAKVSLSAYLEAYQATDDRVRDERLAAHAKHLRQHVDALASKSYWSHVTSAPEFVIMFVPGEGPLNAALEIDPTLWEYASNKQVQILGPMSLVPTLRAIAFGWQQEALAKNAQQVFDLGKEMYGRIGTFAGYMSSVGGQISKTVDAYNKAAASLEGRLLVTARRFNELDLVDAELSEMSAIDKSVVPFSKPELMSPIEEMRLVEIAPAERLEDYGIDAGGTQEDDWRTGS